MTILRISAKCSDLFWAQLYEDDTLLLEYSGYVPDFMPGQHYGDCVELDIDPESGVILNWQPNKVAAAIKRGLS
jgi:hypothetical protein